MTLIELVRKMLYKMKVVEAEELLSEYIDVDEKGNAVKIKGKK